jgi:hypothetical protein
VFVSARPIVCLGGFPVCLVECATKINLTSYGYKHDAAATGTYLVLNLNVINYGD